MIAQSAIGNPWILTPHTPTIQERYANIMRHLHLSIACEFYFKDTIQDYTQHGKLIHPTLQQLEDLGEAYRTGNYIPGAEPHTVVEFRKYLFNYVSGIENSKEIKKAIARTRDYQGLVDILEAFFSPFCAT